MCSFTFAESDDGTSRPVEASFSRVIPVSGGGLALGPI
jgi:hypothetical protein